MYKLLKLNLKKCDEEKFKLKRNDEILAEWKLINNRLEYIFLFINVFTNSITSLILFGKYFFIDYNINNQISNKNQCGCDYSFIKNM